MRKVTPLRKQSIAAILAMEFHETGNPIDAINSLILVCETECELPWPVRDWLHECCVRWLKGEGKGAKYSMDRIMGLSAAGKGKSGAFKTLINDESSYKFNEEMANLCCLGYSPKLAAGAVFEKWRRASPQKRKAAGIFAMQSEKTIYRKYMEWPAHKNLAYHWDAPHKNYLRTFPKNILGKPGKTVWEKQKR